jgi:hypothetical protein
MHLCVLTLFPWSVLECVHTALCAHYIGYYLIQHYGDVAAFERIKWYANGTPVSHSHSHFLNSYRSVWVSLLLPTASDLS